MYSSRNIQVHSQNEVDIQNFKPLRRKSAHKREKHKNPNCLCSLGNSPRPNIENFDGNSKKCLCQNDAFQDIQMFSKEDMLQRIHKLKSRLSYFENKFQVIESDTPLDFSKKWKQNANNKLANTENASKKKKRSIRIQVRSKNSTTTTSETNLVRAKSSSNQTEKSSQCLVRRLPKNDENIKRNKSLIVVMENTKNDSISNSSNENLLFMRKTLEELKDMTENLNSRISCMLGNVSSQKSDFGTDTRDSGVSSLSHIALPSGSDDISKEKYAEITQSVENVEKKIDRLTYIVEKTLKKDSRDFEATNNFAKKDPDAYVLPQPPLNWISSKPKKLNPVVIFNEPIYPQQNFDADSYNEQSYTHTHNSLEKYLLLDSPRHPQNKSVAIQPSASDIAPKKKKKKRKFVCCV